MASHTLPLFFIVLVLACLRTAQASFQDEVRAAESILNDLPKALAIPFCSGYKPSTSSYVTESCITVTSTTILTFHTTSTIYVAATAPAKRSQPKLPRDTTDTFPQRATWCSDYNVPCRLVQYDHDVIAEACQKYLNGDQDEDVSPEIAQAMWDYKYGLD
ncbi:uncharacterized protein K460DRAFT_405528 [Cucurbitaria berberidis CBS 394.84]|uniref:Uncharacterized protein n=1 Tax=Cucurbitaria berberidis CBS 394.84 TaxID=1168544 RepID=A0A9P4GFS9_9PLEO|nr:uncharacterized protein K460DRAFT_405528 [Cucurbitaria berberidis CBS 394.84]KAF1845263.1 hypothetical protein K460DRAFT_405528 [Cucurbitaria berberidis CBS 394.84]